jgi:hypothetical protein
MITTSKEINLDQLDKELGSQGLCGDFNDPKNKIIKVADNSTVTDEELEAAIAAHVAGPSQQEIIMLNREQGLAKLKELGFTENEIKALLGSL